MLIAPLGALHIGVCHLQKSNIKPDFKGLPWCKICQHQVVRRQIVGNVYKY